MNRCAPRISTSSEPVLGKGASGKCLSPSADWTRQAERKAGFGKPVAEMERFQRQVDVAIKSLPKHGSSSPEREVV